jgi:dienelactone hydrolase
MLRYFLPLAITVRPGIVIPRIKAYIIALRASPPVPFDQTPQSLKIGVAGFCWGGKYAILLCHNEPSGESVELGGGEGKPLVDCGFTGHPSFVTLPGDLDAVVAPLSIANGDMDMMLPGEKMVEAKRILDAKEGGGVHEAVIYEGATHGFSVRGDPKDPKQAEMGMKAEDQAVSWFKKHFT